MRLHKFLQIAMYGKRFHQAQFAALLVVCAAAIAQAETPAISSAPLAPWLGASSCSARACHGSQGAGRQHPLVWGNEHSLWIEQDPHHRAYAVLLNPLGQQIARRLGLQQPAHEARECLACHAPSASSEPSYNHACPPTYVTEGVGCEACHGPSRDWIVAHTAADWNLLSPIEKEQLGFRNTKDLFARAQLCSQCHVGSAQGDVNHDLIAAGHPRLTFEFASHLHRMPSHWDEKGENDRLQRPAFEARAWTIGQAVAAKAQLELLIARADASREGRPGAVWPEFAEYSCYDCHRELQGSVSPSAAAQIGRPAWGTWYFPLLSLAGTSDQELNVRLTRLRDAMASLNINEAQAADAARDVLSELTVADSPNLQPTQINEQLARLAQEGPSLIHGQWDVAAQLYLALAAFQQARLDAQRRVTAEDRAIQRLLGVMHRDLQPRNNAQADAVGRRLDEARQTGLFGRLRRHEAR